MKTYIDIHCHILNVAHVPMLTLLKRTGAKLQVAAHEVPGTDIDDRARDYVRICERPCSDILECAVQQARQAVDADEIILVPLMMDMEDEDGIKTFEWQFQDSLAALGPAEPGLRVLPFLGLDPRCFDLAEETDQKRLKERLDRIRKRRRQHGDVIGLKLYPPLGFSPLHPTLTNPEDGVFAYCVEHDIPITAHCAPGGFVSGRISNKKANRLTHPRNWRKVLEMKDRGFDKLRLNLAHFGGGASWRAYLTKSGRSGWATTAEESRRKRLRAWVSAILELLDNHDKVYTDLSFLANHPRVLRYIRKKFEDGGDRKWSEQVKGKILFGTDFYMIRTEIDYAEYVRRAMDPEEGLGEALFEQFAQTNPARFLRL